MEIENCDALREVGLLSLEENAGLQRLTGISGLRRAPHVRLAWNPALEDLSALSSIESMNLTLYDLRSLSDLRPLRGVTLFDVHVIKLPQLRTLDGLERVGTRPAQIDVQNNTLLEDIRALRNVQHATEVPALGQPEPPVVGRVAEFGLELARLDRSQRKTAAM